MRLRRQRPDRGARAGFTLIELMAVVLILGLMATLLGPPLGLARGRALEEAADRIGAACELARQRAVMTGRDHRVVLDLDWGVHRVEWQPPPDPPSEREPAAKTPPDGEVGAASPIDLAPPVETVLEFFPIPSEPGRDARLPDGIVLVAVELEDSEVREGRVVIGFPPDGTADPARVWLADEDAGSSLRIDVLPLADAVVVTREDA
jgi:prepilin-type N-terminal cleavage/methylation domain-containing protein